MKTIDWIELFGENGGNWKFSEGYSLQIYQPESLHNPLPDGSSFIVNSELEDDIPFWVVIHNIGDIADLNTIPTDSVCRFKTEVIQNMIFYVPPTKFVSKVEGVAKTIPNSSCISYSLESPHTFIMKVLCAKDIIEISVPPSRFPAAENTQRYVAANIECEDTPEYKEALGYFTKLAQHINDLFSLAKDLFTATYILECDTNKAFYRNNLFADIALNMVRSYSDLLLLRSSNLLSDQDTRALTFINFRTKLESLAEQTSGKYKKQVTDTIELMPARSTAESFSTSYTKLTWDTEEGIEQTAEGPTAKIKRNKYIAHSEEKLQPYARANEIDYMLYSDIITALGDTRMVVDMARYIENAVFNECGFFGLPENANPDILFNPGIAIAFSQSNSKTL